ncbi:coiled-coil domain-containing protein 86 [Folsomia candida]|uniref:Coiled-coil domain-containing protein 86 n=1 Tax=Folsomia candida TaxID=158441 RepID=A0A226F600_FOLCA|nr:coiled-coil domain-containing protein 86 [Folsomia candida]OXA64621.1 Coiled-coil domain-containing protein 86 [Folsomia candida]
MVKSKGKGTEASTKKVEDPNVRGPPKSGRFWKSQKERTTTMVKSRKKVGAVKLEALRAEKDRVKQLSTAIKDARKTEAQEKRRREEENKKKKEENAKKSEIVQVIKNTAKLKRMKKKALRKVEKRDTTVVVKNKKAPAVVSSTEMDTL